MSGIEEVIKRSRAEGGFTKKGSFTLASEKARLKVSEFALPSKFHYCLELIQSAVALGADYLDIATDETSFILSMGGAHYTRREIEHLFDYLFSTEQDNRSRALRQLVVGTATAFSLPKTKVIIESGDGSKEGSTRFEMSSLTADAAIGSPDKPVNGAFVKVIHARCKNVFDECSMEKNMIMECCQYMPTPIMLNNDTPFGCGFSRVARLNGYHDIGVGFDEGDLYGGLTLKESELGTSGGLKIISDGVEIVTLPSPIVFTPKREFIEVRSVNRFGELVEDMKKIVLRVVGVATFDRLNKTASRYDIVKDDRMAELTERLKPYINQLLLRADARDGDRLEYLIDRDAPRYRSPKKAYCFRIQREPFEMKASFAVDTRKEAAREMKVYLVTEQTDGTEKLIQYLRFEFPIPSVGRIFFSGDFIHALTVLQKGDEGYDVNRTVVVVPEVLNVVRAAIKAELPSLKEHLESTFFKAHIESQWNAQQRSSGKAKSLKEPKTPPSQEVALTETEGAIGEKPSEDDNSPKTLGGDSAKSFQTFGGKTAKTLTVEVPEEKPDAAVMQQLNDLVRMREALFAPNTVSNEESAIETVPVGTVQNKLVLDTAEYDSEPQDEAWAGSERTVASSQKSAPSKPPRVKTSRITMPLPEEIRLRLLESQKSERDEILSSFLLRILNADGANRRFLIRFNNRVQWIENPQFQFAAWVDKRLADKERGGICINRVHPLISKKLDECGENPLQVYAIALLVGSALSAETDRQPDIKFSSSNLACLCRSIIRCLS